MRVERIENSFAGRVRGCHVADGVGKEGLLEVEKFLSEYPVLCFPDQPLTDEQQSAFVHSLGPALEAAYGEVAREQDNNPKLIDIGNLEQDGSLLRKDSTKGRFHDANLLWHTDASFAPRPVRVTALSARTLPRKAPPTQYADMRAAWDSLPPSLKSKCDGLIVEHSIYFSRRRTGMMESDFTPEFRKTFGVPTRQPLVRVHPLSGRKSLYLSAHAGRIVGWSDADSERFLEELTQIATQPAFVYSHQWMINDLVMWDDSCTMHRATPYAGTEPRRLRWTGVTELEPLLQ